MWVTKFWIPSFRTVIEEVDPVEISVEFNMQFSVSAFHWPIAFAREFFPKSDFFTFTITTAATISQKLQGYETHEKGLLDDTSKFYVTHPVTLRSFTILFALPARNRNLLLTLFY